MRRVPFITHPPTSFPARDLLVVEQLPIAPDETVCEIGVGTGHTLAMLARLGADVTGLEISAPVVERLRLLARRHANMANMKVARADVTRDDDVAPFARSFSRVVSCDTLEHVTDPAAFFRSLARLLLPGGRFLVTFPNEPVGRMHGVTRFDRVEELARLLDDAGLVDCRIGAARLRPGPACVAELLGRGPVRVVRRLLGRLGGPLAPAAVRTFEETRFHRHAALWWRLSPAVNLYWHAVQRLMTARGPAYEVDWDVAGPAFEHCQVVIVGRRPEQPVLRVAQAAPAAPRDDAPLPALAPLGTMAGLEAELVELGLPWVAHVASVISL